jgi:hypothetical protein
MPDSLAARIGLMGAGARRTNSSRNASSDSTRATSRLEAASR